MKSVVYIEDGKIVTPKRIVYTHEVTYVAEYFKKKPGKAPTISLKIYDLSLTDVRMEIAKRLEDQTLTTTFASTYLYLLASEIEEALDKDWISYGVQIGSRGETINPLNLCNFKVTTTKKTAEVGLPIKKSSADIYLSLGVCGYYRVALASSVGAYDNQVANKIMILMQEYGYNGSTLVKTDKAFSNNKGFSALIAAYDMFFIQFPDHQFSPLRAGTLSSRNQDCSILGSLDLLRKSLDKELDEIVQWAFAPALVKELKIIIESPDELDIYNSYTPYLHGFCLVEKSPYSTQNVPNIHHWIHIIGSCFNIPRSINARNIGEFDISNVPKNSILMGYAFKRAVNFGRYLVGSVKERDEVLKDLKADPTFALPKEGHPSDQDPGEWFDWFKGVGFDYTEGMKRFIQDSKDAIIAPRVGTIGEWVKNEGF